MSMPNASANLLIAERKSNGGQPIKNYYSYGHHFDMGEVDDQKVKGGQAKSRKLQV